MCFFRPPVNALRRQYFLSFAVIGSVMPLMSVFLSQEAGFDHFQIGLAMALANVPMLLSPALITLLADRSVDSRRILAAAFFVSVMVLGLMYVIPNLGVRMVLFLFHGLAFVAMLPLQDGFFFSWAEHQRASGRESVPYPKVRVWGTIGFILPSVILFFLLREDGSTSRILLCAVAFGALAFFNTFLLPEVPRTGASESEGSGKGEKERLPTREAMRALFSPQARYLCLGLALAYMATIAYYSFIPIYFKEVIGISERHIGLVINIGVTLEIFFTVFMPKLQSVLRLKGIVIVGLVGMALRMGLLALFPSLETALITQVVHGMEVLALFIAPVMFIDRLAGNRFRNSIQGVFTMTVGGVSRVIGAILAGWIASIDLRLLLFYAAGLTLSSALLIALRFRRIPDPSEEANRGSTAGALSAETGKETDS